VLAVLYDMAMVVGGEVRLRPLVTRAVQRLLYHTSFPVGLLLLEVRPRDDHFVEARLEVAIGDWTLTGRVGETLTLPAALVRGEASVIDDPALVSALPGQAKHRVVCVRLPVESEGVILLAAPHLPHAEVPVTQVFQPVMANLARAIVLCRSHEAHAAALVAERDAAQLGLARFRAAVDTAADLVFLIDPATQRFVDVNGTAEAALGESRPALCALGLADFSPELHRAQLAELYRDASSTQGASTVVATLRLRDGAARPVEIRFSAFAPPGEPPLIIAAARDTSQRLRMEAQLRQAQKLDAIGRLAGGVAHDFNNLLTAILGGASSLLEDADASDPRHEELREIEAAALRAAALTKQLLVFSRKSPVAPALVDLRARVDGLVRMLKRLIGERIELVTPATVEHAWAVVDGGLLEQVLLNLAVNARDAMPDGGRLTIDVQHGELDAAQLAEHPGATLGPHEVIAVTDTGSGMSEQVRAHLFEPFFTTKEPGKGTGLGLSTVYGIVQQAGGHVRVWTALGSGSRFEVWLPRAAGPGAVTEETEPAPSSRRGSEVVLLVEDERSVREFTARALRRAGYTVLEATDGAEGLELAKGRLERLDLVMTDVIMPRLGGAELARALRALRADLPVLFVSGYPHDQLDEEAPSRSAFLSKPYPIEVLHRTIRHLLEGPSGS
jgi:PAS domain S-box-containing protein